MEWGEQGNKGEREQGEQGEIENGGIRRTKRKRGTRRTGETRGTGEQGEKRNNKSGVGLSTPFQLSEGKQTE